MYIIVFGFSCKTSFLNLIYHGAGTVVHLLQLKSSMFPIDRMNEWIETKRKPNNELSGLIRFPDRRFISATSSVTRLGDFESSCQQISLQKEATNLDTFGAILRSIIFKLKLL